MKNRPETASKLLFASYRGANKKSDAKFVSDKKLDKSSFDKNKDGRSLAATKSMATISAAPSSSMLADIKHTQTAHKESKYFARKKQGLAESSKELKSTQRNSHLVESLND